MRAVMAIAQVAKNLWGQRPTFATQAFENIRKRNSKKLARSQLKLKTAITGLKVHIYSRQRSTRLIYGKGKWVGKMEWQKMTEIKGKRGKERGRAGRRVRDNAPSLICKSRRLRLD